MEAGDLVAAEDVDGVVDDLDAEGLEEAGGDAFPVQFIEGVIDAVDEPGIAVPGYRYCALAIGEEVESAEPQPGLPGVIIGGGECVDGIGAVVGAEFALGGERGVPAGWAAVGQWGEWAWWC